MLVNIGLTSRTCDNVPIHRSVLLRVAIVDVDVGISGILCPVSLVQYK